MMADVLECGGVPAELKTRLLSNVLELVLEQGCGCGGAPRVGELS